MMTKVRLEEEREEEMSGMEMGNVCHRECAQKERRVHAILCVLKPSFYLFQIYSCPKRIAICLLCYN